ncbi:uncharacterized protein GGS22DRAFT_159185 [Annulohypoxylon maeteangense]|uniref:uncharacterized protein n=1 Tax=Annulohypoxylon maeteangense TaxID=1927788 RepID=UPI0020082012|nr:uncharacterized protein GGS22DRAFT_159185 [Annulohypoxylon maeteangense]KAI0887017.1 hypothetical protein GGS22DRAFT_159185 [Annulohypoxylon maeteangense]
MPPNTGLRIARVHPLLLNHGSGLSAPLLAPLFATTHISQARKRLAPTQSNSSSQRRAASTASRVEEPKKETASPTISELASSPTRPTSPLTPSTTLNPPASTRPPPLELPTRDPTTSTFTYWFRFGKAYMSFYKTGLKAIFTNRSLLTQSATTTTRSDILLRERVHHDIFRVPTFGLLLLLCGELTPFVVLAFPHLTPYTCRIPKQIDALRRRAEARRTSSFSALQRVDTPSAKLHSSGLGSGHVCRSLGLTSTVWDKVGLDSPFSKSLAERAVSRLAADNALLQDGGGVEALVDEEVVLACEDRGFYVREKSVAELRGELRKWLRKAAPRKGGGHEEVRAEAEDKVRGLLLGLDGSDGEN